MDANKNIERLIEDTLHSADGTQRATPKPFLLTRINARRSNGTATLWEKAGWFITRPAVAFSGLCLIILVNVMVLLNTNAANMNADVAQNSPDEYSSTVVTIYDIDNTQP